jgi:hypothetical protein
MKIKNRTWFRALAWLLALMVILPLGTQARAEEAAPYASNYINTASTGAAAAGGGKITISFAVGAASQMDDIGATYIRIYESTDNSTWTWVKDYTNNATPSLMGHNKTNHSGNVSYQGVAGRYYKAYVCLYAGKNGSGDTRNYWTASQRAV